jgi:hypothetical protein
MAQTTKTIVETWMKSAMLDDTEDSPDLRSNLPGCPLIREPRPHVRWPTIATRRGKISLLP